MEKTPILFLAALGFTFVAARAAHAHNTPMLLLAAIVTVVALVAELVRSRRPNA
jgi:hypothetical protein